MLTAKNSSGTYNKPQKAPPETNPSGPFEVLDLIEINTDI